jgi:hypothetical protein
LGLPTKASKWLGRDGFLTAGIGVILVLGELLLRRDSQRWFAFAGGVLAILAASIVFLDFQQILAIEPAAGFYAATDYGIYVTLAGAVLALWDACSSGSQALRNGLPLRP